MAAEAFQRFTGWIEEHKEGIGYFTTTILGGLIDALDGIKTGWNWITSNIKDFAAKIGIDIDLGKFGNYLLEHFGPEAAAAVVLGAIGFAVAGPVGAAVGATVGFTGTFVGRRIEDIQLLLEEVIYGGLKGFIISMSRRGMTFNFADIA